MNLEFNNNHFILGGKYKIFDIPNNQELNVQIIELNDVELMYKDLDKKDKFLYRELEEVKLLETIDEELANRLNNQEVFSIKTDEIKAILGRKEIEHYSKDNFSKLDLNKDTVLISIKKVEKRTTSFFTSNFLQVTSYLLHSVRRLLVAF